MVSDMTTRTLLLGTVAAIAFSAQAQAASINGWYVSLEGGANQIQDNEYDYGFSTPAPTDFNNAVEYDTGWAVLASVGYGFGGNWRVEAEAGYRANQMDQFSSDVAQNLFRSGDLNQATLMANVLYDFPVMARLTLTAGVGAGADYVMVDDGTSGGVNDEDWKFAYQGIVGASYSLSPKLQLTLNYRYLRAQGPDVSGPTEVEAFEDISNHTVTAGLRYAFGSEAVEMPAPPAAEPTPPPAPAGSDAPREFIVFFGHNQSELTPEAINVVKQAALSAKEYGNAALSLVGHADRSGSDSYNSALSLRRANAVKSALVAEGIADASITVSGKGEGDPLVPTADGVREPQNRRVHISL